MPDISPRQDPREAEERELRASVLRLDGHAWGIAFGVLLGLGLFAATAILVLKGGPVVGPHLSLLGVYLPGYRVTLPGSLIGFGYGLAIGYAFGRLISAVYNRVAARSG